MDNSHFSMDSDDSDDDPIAQSLVAYSDSSNSDNSIINESTSVIPPSDQESTLNGSIMSDSSEDIVLSTPVQVPRRSASGISDSVYLSADEGTPHHGIRSASLLAGNNRKRNKLSGATDKDTIGCEEFLNEHDGSVDNESIEKKDLSNENTSFIFDQSTELEEQSSAFSSPVYEKSTFSQSCQELPDGLELSPVETIYWKGDETTTKLLPSSPSHNVKLHAVSPVMKLLGKDARSEVGQNDEDIEPFQSDENTDKEDKDAVDLSDDIESLHSGGNMDKEDDKDSLGRNADDIESFHSDGNTSDKELETNCEHISVVDLTQSDSLQNSPVGAVRQNFPGKRDLTDIISELSIVSHDIMMKETLLDTVNISSMPDNGRNLQKMVSKLKQRKQELDQEMHDSEEYAAQQIELDVLNASRAPSSSKQSVLNFQAIKMEPKEEDNASQDPSKSFNESKLPDWGDLPKPDMTISGFGKRAMQTHLTEKSLTAESLASLHKALKTCPTEDTFAKDPKLLKVELMPHQKHGLAWMLWREQENPPGGILADDMGLGKTLSMISLILKDIENKATSEDPGTDSDDDSDEDSHGWMKSRRSRMPRGGTLVVCPASVIGQWEQEILKRVKRRALSVEQYHGAKRETIPHRLAKNDVVLTTYQLVSRESGAEKKGNAPSMKDKGAIFMVNWERIILDEAHMVRNHKSMMALGVCELVGRRRWCLTGTPIQNKEIDLYALLKFLRCSPFDDLIVWKKWVDNKSPSGMQRLNTMLKSLMLRRTKEQLQSTGDLNCLPEKYSETIDVHLDPDELQIYEKIALFSASLFGQFLHQRAEKQQVLDARYGFSTKPTWEQPDGSDNQFRTTEELVKMHRQQKGISEVKTHQILTLLLRLRQTCCHPGLVKKMVENGDLDIGGSSVEDSDGMDVDLFNKMNNLNIDESKVESDDIADDLNKSMEISTDHPALDFNRPSAKIRAVLDLIQEKIVDTDEKAIVVSQWTSMLDIIEKFVKDMRIKCAMLTGKIPVPERQGIVYAFNKPYSGPQVLLLSLTAGGVGLNLMGANHLLMVDNHWNPQLENQACDRIYRVGQKKDVYIYKFITVNSIEERIKKLQANKLTMAENVLTGTRNTQASKLTLEDLKMLFSVPSLPKPDPVTAATKI